MFAEEEWTDSLPAEEQKHSVFRTETLSKKSKAISKRCLQRTLQTLGSVPKWDIVKASDSDGEVEAAPVHTVKKKKKCKKRKKISEAEGEQHGEVDVPQTPVKKQKKQKKPSSSASVSNEDSKELQKASGQRQNDMEKKLSRQQWKNKRKNKKRCKNKFLQYIDGATEVDFKQAKLERTEDFPKKEKSPVGDLPSERVKSGEKGDFVVPVNTHELTNIKKKKKEKESNITNHLQSEPVFKQLKEAKDVILLNADELCGKQQPVRVENDSQVQTKTSKGQIAECNTIFTEKKQETVNMSKDQGRNRFDRSIALRARMEKRLEAARFRYINELLYTSSSGEAKRMFKQDPDAIGVYHKGYTEQVKRWPANPVDSIISYIRQKPASLAVADFGCGDCKIALSVKNKVHCFDLAPVCDLVTACDMANVPLADSTVDIAVFCLSLMGTNLGDFLAEANRVLVDGGVLKIAEVASRFEDERQFIGALSRLGFKLVSKDTDNSHFYSFEFTKIRNAPVNVKKIGLQLKPCLYKKR